MIFDGGRRGPTYRFEAAHGKTESTPAVTDLPAFLTDALPDAWGTKLIKRDLGGIRNPYPHELLLGVSDAQRTGSLRFFEDGQPLAPLDGQQIPPLVDLGKIDTEIKKVVGDPSYRVSELIGIGSQSLGGARPKATVQDREGRLWVAKFSTMNDDPKLESQVMNLALRCGIDCAITRHTSVANSDVVLSRRFDRGEELSRIGMRSYAAVLGIRDAGRDVDWFDIVQASDPRDWSELWRRAVFGALLHNIDDHVRNHSQIRVSEGDEWVWRLAPAYDITHEPEPVARHALAVLGQRDAVGIARELPGLADLAHVAPSEGRMWVKDMLSTVKMSSTLSTAVHPDVAKVLQEWVLEK